MFKKTSWNTQNFWNSVSAILSLYGSARVREMDFGDWCESEEVVKESHYFFLLSTKSIVVAIMDYLNDIALLSVGGRALWLYQNS